MKLWMSTSRRATPSVIPACLAAGVLMLAMPASFAVAQESALPEGFDTEMILQTTETRDGDPLEYLGGAAQITSVIGTIGAGGRTALHEHPVPTFVYVLEGEVELETEGGEPFTYAQGEAYIEALNREHQLFNRGDATARILVVFAGAEDVPTTVAAEAAQ
jgi:quercetin dioxygenase-like cupin family protein